MRKAVRRAVRLSAALTLLAVAGCATFEGSGLVPGQAKADDVQKAMGAPSDRLVFPDGSVTWFYTTAPMGRTTHAVHLSPEGVVQSIEQVLTQQSIAKLVSGTTTSAQVKEILGPPGRITRMDRQQRNVWEYRMYNAAQDDFDLYVQLSDDDVVREVVFLKDYHKEPGGRGRR